MKVCFKKCVDAVKTAVDTKSYGVFYSEKPDADTSVHVHECCEVLMCLSGGKTFFINDKIYDVKDGDIFVINPFEAHKITCAPEQPFKRWVLQIHPAFLYSHSSENTNLAGCFYLRNEHTTNRLSPNVNQRARFEELFSSLGDDSRFGDDIIKDIRVIELAALLNGCFSENIKDFKYVPAYENKVIEESIAYINENISDKLQLSDIAAHCYVSVNRLCCLFKKHLGTTVLKYIISKRITEAKKLLKKGESVSDTALSCGFSDYSNFIRTFKSIVGVSPGKYAGEENSGRQIEG